MIYLFIYSVALFGLSFIVGQSQLTLPLRSYIASRYPNGSKWPLELIECPACFSTWIGIVFAAAFPLRAIAVFDLPTSTPLWQGIIVAAAYSCGSSAIIGLLTKLMPVTSGELRMPPDVDDGAALPNGSQNPLFTPTTPKVR